MTMIQDIWNVAKQHTLERPLFSKTMEPQASAAESLADDTEVDTSLGKDVDDPS
jgi:hypothetical protein